MTGVLDLRAVTGLASILAIVFDVEIIEINASFFTLWAENNCLSNSTSNCNFSKSSDLGLELADSNFFCYY